MTYVKERDLKELFKIVIDNLKETIKDGTASPKDKEIAMKILDQYQIGYELEASPHTPELDDPLPFDEMSIPN